MSWMLFGTGYGLSARAPAYTETVWKSATSRASAGGAALPLGKAGTTRSSVAAAAGSVGATYALCGLSSSRSFAALSVETVTTSTYSQMNVEKCSSSVWRKMPCSSRFVTKRTPCVCVPPGWSLIGWRRLGVGWRRMKLVCRCCGISMPSSSRGCVEPLQICNRHSISVPGGMTLLASRVSVMRRFLGVCDGFEKSSSSLFSSVSRAPET